jgi:glycogen debranching enzyme
MMRPLGNLPDVWGEGAIFAFSGLDGPTDTLSQFLATLGDEPYNLLIHTPRRRVLTVRPSYAGAVVAATNDVLAVETPGGELAVTFAAWHTIVGVVPEGTRLALSFEGEPVLAVSENLQTSWDAEHQDALVLVAENGRFALAYGRSRAEAHARARQGLTTNLARLLSQRLAIYRRLPTRHVPVPTSPARERLLKKCVSVIKVNTLAPEGSNRQAWSTPDRVPHRHMWLWDSVFHSFGMNYLDPQVAWQFLQSVLERQQPDGMIPHVMQVDGRVSEITQPPILAWGVWQNYQLTQNTDQLAYALPRLEQYLEWNLAHRDQNGNGLLEWLIEGDPHCRSGESGMDNSPRFDDAIQLDAVDFSTFQALDMGYVARIAWELGESDRAAHWQERASATAQSIHQGLWHPGDGFYYDRDFSGRFTGVKAVSGFLPLLLDDIPPSHVDRLAAHLDDPATFAAPFPVPSVALDHPAWSTDMWRGATWINMNYLIVIGLRKHGRLAEADRLAQATVNHVAKYYQQFGVVFEFYDARDIMPPTWCHRKGPVPQRYDIRVKMSSIRDYHWTAALVASLLLDED